MSMIYFVSMGLFLTHMTPTNKKYRIILLCVWQYHKYRIIPHVCRILTVTAQYFPKIVGNFIPHTQTKVYSLQSVLILLFFFKFIIIFMK